MTNSLRPHELQHARPPCPSPTPRFHPNSCASSRWCHPAISSSVIPFSSCPQSLLASESFLMSQLFAWGGQSTGASALASFLPKKSQGWSPSEWTAWISLQSKRLSRVFSTSTVQKHRYLRCSAFFIVRPTSIHDYWTKEWFESWNIPCFMSFRMDVKLVDMNTMLNNTAITALAMSGNILNLSEQ